MSPMPNPEHKMTEDDYLTLERESDIKHEFANGEVYAMAGASWNHTVIVSNINTRLNVKLEKSTCLSVTSDMRVHVVSEKSYRFPDVIVLCGEPQFKDTDVDILTNPTVLAEVMSPTTAFYGMLIMMSGATQNASA